MQCNKSNIVASLIICLFVDALFNPYSGLIHDARLHAFPIFNSIHDNTLGADIFLQFKNQSSYSLFIIVLEILGKRIGLESSFFILYVLSKILFFIGCIKLTKLFTKNETIYAAILSYLCSTTIPIVGPSVITINESFFTLRILAVGLSTLSLSYLLERRELRSILLSLFSTTIHPLIGLSTFLVVIFSMVVQRQDSRHRIIGIYICCTLLGLALILPPASYSLFGQLDPSWHTFIKSICQMLSPFSWTYYDSIGCFSFIIVSLLAFQAVEKQLIIPYSAILYISICGLCAAVIADYFGITLLLQSQPYRAMWIGQYIVSFVGMSYVLRKQSSHLNSFVFVYLLYRATPQDLHLTSLLSLYILILIILKKLEYRQPYFVSILISLGIIALFDFALFLHQLVENYSFYLNNKNLALTLILYPTLQNNFLKLALSYIIFHFTLKKNTSYIQLSILVIAFLTIQITSATVRSYEVSQGQITKRIKNEIVKLKKRKQEKLTVYWPNQLGKIWFSLHEMSYYHHFQSAASIFSSEAAKKLASRRENVSIFEYKNCEENYHASQLQFHSCLHALGQTINTSERSLTEEIKRSCKDNELDIFIFQGTLDKNIERIQIADYNIINCKMYQ